jgi:DNA-binding SARP family transcriptional activator/TolB-like protein
LRLLGGASLSTLDGRDRSPRGVKARALLAYVALTPGGVVDRGRAAGLLWSAGTDAKASLRQCIREIGVATEGLAVFTADVSTITLDLRTVEVDAIELLRATERSDERGLDEVLDRYGGELLADLEIREPEFETWLSLQRARLREALEGFLVGALRRKLTGDELAAARRIADALVALDPAHEEAHRALMHARARSGDVVGAVRQYQLCARMLQRELDAAPAPETEALLREIRRGASPGGPSIARPMVPVTRAWRGPSRASIAVQERVPPPGDQLDLAVAAALGAGVRAALGRKSLFHVVPSGQGVIGTDASSWSKPQYGVELTLIRMQDRVRLCTELWDRRAQRMLWAERHDRSLAGDLFATVDDLAVTVAGQVDREVEPVEIARAFRAPIEASSSYDCVLRAIPLIFKLTPESFADAERLLLAAQEADADDPLVYAWRAFWYFLSLGQGWQRDVAAAREQLSWIVAKALELDPSNAMALAVAGHIASFVEHDYGQALDLFDRSLRLDPNGVHAWDLSALTLCYTGDAAAALRRLADMQELWQRHPQAYYFRTTACIALLLAGRHDEAIELCRRTVRENPHFHAPYRPLIASLGHTGQIEEAQRYVEALRRLEPSFSVSWFRTSYPPLPDDYSEHYVAGLRKAGVPED